MCADFGGIYIVAGGLPSYRFDRLSGELLLQQFEKLITRLFGDDDWFIFEADVYNNSCELKGVGYEMAFVSTL